MLYQWVDLRETMVFSLDPANSNLFWLTNLLKDPTNLNKFIYADVVRFGHWHMPPTTTTARMRTRTRTTTTTTTTTAAAAATTTTTSTKTKTQTKSKSKTKGYCMDMIRKPKYMICLVVEPSKNQELAACRVYPICFIQNLRESRMYRSIPFCAQNSQIWGP